MQQIVQIVQRVVIAVCLSVGSQYLPPSPQLVYAEEIAMRGPIGWDTLRDTGNLPTLSHGVYTHQFASTDSTGTNNDHFHCYKILQNQSCELAEAKGAGEIDSIWVTRTGNDISATGNLIIILDGKTVVHSRFQDIVDGRLGAPFIFPIVANTHQSSGGNYIIAPMTYHSSMQVITDHDPEYFHVTYRSFDSSRGVETFDPTIPHWDIINNLRRPIAQLADGVKFHLSPLSEVTLASFTQSGTLNTLDLHIPILDMHDRDAIRDILSAVSLVITVDGEMRVDSPLGEFFGGGYNNASVRSWILAMGQGTQGHLISRWPMPYGSSLEVKLVNNTWRDVDGDQAIAIRYSPQIRALLLNHRIGYFRAVHHQAVNAPGEDFLFLHTNVLGKFVGVSGVMKGDVGHKYLEGNEHIFYDYSPTPQLDGTGTEDFFEGGWYFNEGSFSNPLNGASLYECNDSWFSHSECIAAYRLFLHDSIAFNSDIVVRIQHGPQNDVDSTYSFTSFWYESVKGN